jgi:WD40 repeat protein/serine/threonine protein kinase
MMADHGQAPPRLGSYRLVKQLGRGGFAVVFLGEHIYLQRKAAIKISRVDPGLLTSSDLESFLIESRTIANLEHPHIVRVLEFGVDGSTPFLVMEYAPNGSLLARHPRGTVVPPSMIVQYVKQVAAALQYAHERNVIHCDVKPENMLLGRNNEVLLADFGIAAAVQSATRPGESIGTPHYMAPEQFVGKPRPASDQYALGVVVYRWLCGHLPFEGATPLEFYRLHTESQPPSLRKKAPEIPEGVERTVFTALEKSPQHRFKSVREFAAALEEALQPRRSVGASLRLLSESPWQSGETTEVAQPLPAARPLLPTAAMVLSPPFREIPLAEELIEVAAPDSPLARPTGGGDVIVSGPLPLPVPRALAVEAPEEDLGRSKYTGHSAWVAAVAWPPDGQRIASGSWDKTVQIWDVVTSRAILTYTGHTHTVKAVAWSPHGTYIVSGSWDNTVHIWSSTTGTVVLVYQGHTAQVEATAWSPDGTSIASAGHDGTVQVWKIDQRGTVLTYRGHSGPVWSVAWSPDGRHLASTSSDGTVQIWEAATGQTLSTYRSHHVQVSVVAWSPDGRSIASGSRDGSVRVWDGATGKTLLSYIDAAGAVKALGWSPDGRYLASAVKVVQVWDVTQSPGMLETTPRFTYRGHSAWVNALAWSPDGRAIASAGDDHTVQMWQLHPHADSRG